MQDLPERRRNSFIFYRSFAEALNGLSNNDQLTLLKAIIKKSLDDEDMELEGIQNNLFALIKPILEANTQRFLDGSKGAAHGKLGGRPKKQKQNNLLETPKGLLPKTPNKDKDVNKEKEKEKDNDFISAQAHTKTLSFKKPSLEEVSNYCSENSISIDCEKFINFYESKGWMIGKNKMKDWRASIRTWARNDSSKNKKSILEGMDFS